MFLKFYWVLRVYICVYVWMIGFLYFKLLCDVLKSIMIVICKVVSMEYGFDIGWN